MDKKSFGRQAGFTLIELVVVIVILGILAATAAPKFIDLSSDAMDAKLKAMEGSLKSANTLVYSKALLSGEHTKAIGEVDIAGVKVATIYGYLAPSTTAVKAAIDADFADIGGPTDSFDADYGIYGEATTKPTSVLGIAADSSGSGFQCLLLYSIATDNKPAYNSVDCE
ncbi:type II secretion system protein [Ferrimonas lipolytica]|uniref:Prepilin-type N-terminal cleavage/methylation domain-containing protein n=1 Tax=Ferrimonas lipolytica TaxID=2724191 RepID=A0A6H1UHD1_9GAMM|nr:prepilin-type N-terminal cleavage/methylation domain-containing protein [Ferrimonas lipolytica]QIZ77626.1 prepilin-type N-terminal cleavage/methylation domain-containing protein [Ferrimonas lipolytica]